MFLRAVLINALHAAFENAVVAFNRVRVAGVALGVANPFVHLMLNRAMAGKLFADAFVPVRLDPS
jgi:hypothetical protein